MRPAAGLLREGRHLRLPHPREVQRFGDGARLASSCALFLPGKSCLRGWLGVGRSERPMRFDLDEGRPSSPPPTGCP